MKSKIIRFIACMVSLALSCSAFAQTQVTEPAASASSLVSVAPATDKAVSVDAPVILALAPIFPAKYYSVESKAMSLFGVFGLVGMAVATGIQNERRTEFKSAIESRFDVSKALVSALKYEFKEAGRVLIDLESPQYYPDDPEVLDYKLIKSKSDFILVADIFDIGVKSPINAIKYIPRLNITFYLTNRNNENVVFEKSIYFGADAGGNENDYYIPIDDSYHFDGFNDVIEGHGKLVEAYELGVKVLAKSVVKQIGRVKLETSK